MTGPARTDEHYVAELRERGLVGPIPASFLASYRRDREFMETVRRVWAMPGGPEKLDTVIAEVVAETERRV